MHESSEELVRRSWEEACRMAERFAEAAEDGPGVTVARAIAAECKRRALKYEGVSSKESGK
jgi:hypothetical protein